MYRIRVILMSRVGIDHPVYYLFTSLLLKEGGSARLGESDLQTISPKITAPQYKPIYRKKRKGTTVEDKKGSSSLGQ